jgi:hypothetical protein
MVSLWLELGSGLKTLRRAILPRQNERRESTYATVVPKPKTLVAIDFVGARSSQQRNMFALSMRVDAKVRH